MINLFLDFHLPFRFTMLQLDNNVNLNELMSSLRMGEWLWHMTDDLLFLVEIPVTILM